MIEHPIRLSCGHGVDDFDEGYPAVTKDWTHDQYGSHRVLRHSTVCRPCLDRYHQHGLLFESEEQGVGWVTEDDIVVRLQKRAEIRRFITTTLAEGTAASVAELLEEAAAAIIRLRGY
jgi:hypothetical protein